MNELMKAMNADALSKEAHKELSDMMRANGYVRMEKLSKEVRNEVKKLMESEVPSKSIKKVCEIMELSVQGIEHAIKCSDNLMLCFHEEKSFKEMVKLYNACAKFVALYNSVEIDHGDCIKKSKS